MKKLFLVSMVVLSFISGISLADENTAKLKAFIQNVQNHHPAFKRFKALEDKVKAQEESMRAYLYNPEFSFEGESRNNAEEVRIYGIAQTLDISGKTFVKKRIGKYFARSKKAEIFGERANYIANIVKAIAGYESANKVMELVLEQAKLMNKFVKVGEKRGKAGDIGRTELALARLAGAQAQSLLANATATLETAKFELNKICNCSPETAPILTDKPPEIVFSDDFQQLATKLPAYRAAQAVDEAAKQNTSLKRRERIPDPTLSIGTGSEGRTSLITFGLSIPIPVFNTGASQMREAAAESLEAGATFHEVRTSILAELKTKSNVYKGHQKALASWNKLAKPSLSDYTKTLEKQWNAGELSASDYLLQVKQGIETAITGAEIKTHAWEAWADYMALTGKIEPWVKAEIKTNFKEIK